MAEKKSILISTFFIQKDGTSKDGRIALFACNEITFFASGGQGLFLKKPPLDPAKTFI